MCVFRMEEAGKRTVKLFCPSLSQVAQVVARDDQRLDLGFIARTFGLDPASLKLNGHFISRGVDLIASSVTWKSLISFFSSRGLSTGVNGSAALLVDGRLCKLGSKRAHDSNSAVVEDGTPSTSHQGYNNVNGKHRHGDVNIHSNKRFKDTGSDSGSEKVANFNTLSLKRKLFMEDDNSLKRIRVDESSLGSSRRKEDGHSGTVSKVLLPCSFIGVNTKRVREDDTLMPASCKKIRG